MDDFKESIMVFDPVEGTFEVFSPMETLLSLLENKFSVDIAAVNSTTLFDKDLRLRADDVELIIEDMKKKFFLDKNPNMIKVLPSTTIGDVVSFIYEIYHEGEIYQMMTHSIV